MNIIGIDMGKYKSYVVVEIDNKVIREGYIETTKEGITSSLSGIENPTIIVESCSLLDYVVPMLQGYNIVAAHPSRVHLITSSFKKTDKNDAHVLIDLYKSGYLPTSYIPSKEVHEQRDLCRTRRYLVSKQTSIKNKIRDCAYRNGLHFDRFNKKTMKEASEMSQLMSVLVSNLECMSKNVHLIDAQITKAVKSNHDAQLLKTIPGIGDYSALSIAAEIADVNRFSSEDRICAYAGMVQQTFQTGTTSWRGHLIKRCDNFIKYLLIECISVHVKRCRKCFICKNYGVKRCTNGAKAAKVSAARKLLKVMYYMLKQDQFFWSYLRGRELRQWNSTALRSSSDYATLSDDRRKIAALLPIGDCQQNKE